MDARLIPTRSRPRYALGPILGIQAMELITGIGLTLLGRLRSLPAWQDVPT